MLYFSPKPNDEPLNDQILKKQFTNTTQDKKLQIKEGFTTYRLSGRPVRVADVAPVTSTFTRSPG
jgi:hypothetical protein